MSKKNAPEGAERPGAMGKAEMETMIRARQAYDRADGWRGELEEIRAEYPGLDLEQGLKSPELRELLRAGLGFKAAFEAANLDEIKRSIHESAERQAYDRIRKNAGRDVENGIAASKSAPYSSGARGMSKSDRDDIVKRVLMGEEIRL